MTLDRAIIGLVEKGTFDAHKIVTKLVARKDWPDIVTASAEELALERAQVLLRLYRRSAEREAVKKSSRTVTERSGRTRKVRTGEIHASDIADIPVFITGQGHKRYGDCSSEDFRIRAAMYEKIAGHASAWEGWSLGIAVVLDKKNAATLDRLGSTLIPAPPSEGGNLDQIEQAAA